jgi:hypothetical protein
MKKNVIIIVVAVTLAAVSCIFGYAVGHRSAVRDQDRFDMSVNLGLYRLLEKGDTNAVVSKLRFLVYMDSDYYDSHFGSETVTASFAKTLVDARAIAAEERRHVVPISSILTNIPHTPDAKITF